MSSLFVEPISPNILASDKLFTCGITLIMTKMALLKFQIGLLEPPGSRFNAQVDRLLFL